MLKKLLSIKSIVADLHAVKTILLIPMNSLLCTDDWVLMDAGRQANGVPPAKPQARKDITKPLLRLHSMPVMLRHSSPSSIRSLAEPCESSHDSRRLTDSSGLAAQLGTSPGTAEQASSAAADITQSAHLSLPPRAQPPPTGAAGAHLGHAAAIKATAAFQGAPSSHSAGLVLPDTTAPHPIPLPPVQTVHTRGTCHSGAIILPARTKSAPASIKRCDIHQMPSRTQSTLSMVEAAVKAASLSCRALLANMLLRMSTKSEHRSSENQTDSKPTGLLHGRADNVSVVKLAGNTLAPLDRFTSLHAKIAPICTEDSQAGISQCSAAEQQVTEQTGPATRLKRLYSLAAKSAPPYDSPLADIWQDGQMPADSDFNSMSPACDSSQDIAPGRKTKRTLSDQALEALVAVKNLKCPTIDYSNLQIVRKIGEGSIGQVRHTLPSCVIPVCI